MRGGDVHIRTGLIALLFPLLLSSCAVAGRSSVPMSEVAFAPELAVDLAEMTETASGLHYRDLVVGEGAPPAEPGRRLSIRYIGWLPTGRQVDDNITADAPFEFRLGDPAVIRGWNEGLEGMRAGGQRMLVVPPALAYGRWGRGRVPPGSTLVFIVELVSVS
jgi:FKBP-type peptidyl-prolyl cis-trans isomerase